MSCSSLERCQVWHVLKRDHIVKYHHITSPATDTIIHRHNGQTDGRQTVTLHFPLDAASVKNK